VPSLLVLSLLPWDKPMFINTVRLFIHKIHNENI